jgi:hypothetical protein
MNCIDAGQIITVWNNSLQGHTVAMSQFKHCHSLERADLDRSSLSLFPFNCSEASELQSFFAGKTECLTVL